MCEVRKNSTIHSYFYVFFAFFSGFIFNLLRLLPRNMVEAIHVKPNNVGGCHVSKFHEEN
jgi:hypothetical protein